MSIFIAYLFNGIFNNPFILYLMGIEFFLFHENEDSIERVKHYISIFISIILVRTIFYSYLRSDFIKFAPVIFLLIYIFSKFFENLLNIHVRDNIIIMSTMTVFLIIGKENQIMDNLQFFLNSFGVFIFFLLFSIVKNSFYDNIYGKKIPTSTDGYPIILFIISGVLLVGTILRGIIL